MFYLVLAAVPPVFIGCGFHRLITYILEYAAEEEIPQKITEEFGAEDRMPTCAENQEA